MWNLNLKYVKGVSKQQHKSSFVLVYLVWEIIVVQSTAEFL